MSGFLALVIIGLVGLVMMAIPGLNRHGHSAHVGAPGALRLGHAAGHGAAHAAQVAGAKAGTAVTGAANSLMRWIPSPRMIFSLMALYGASGIALTEGAHLPRWLAALLAVIPAGLFERYVISPIWKSLLQFEGIPSSPLEQLTFHEAEAVTPFRNGKGIVIVERDGRAVQFRASLLAEQSGAEVRVGDKVRIEQVDAEHERVTVSIG